MTPEDWKRLEKAYNYLMDSSDSKIESQKWIIYKVGGIIRIDIKTKE